MSARGEDIVMDRASEDDRRWFEQNPHRQHRARTLLVGEIPVPPLYGDGLWCVAVRNVMPGLRVRLPIRLQCMPLNDEASAESLFRNAFQGDGA